METKNKKHKLEKRFCPRCGRRLTDKRGLVSYGYSYTCLNCDEDFYEFETMPEEFFAKKVCKTRHFGRTTLDNSLDKV